MKYRCFSTILLLIVTHANFAQSSKERQLEFIELGVFVHSISMPFKASNNFIGFNRWPGVKIGTSLPLRDNNIGIDYRPSLSFYHQKDLHFGWHFNHQIAMVYPSGKRVGAELLSGLGYLLTFEDAPIYRTKNGKYEQKRDWGRSQLTISLGLGMYWKMGKESNNTVFIQHEFLLQLPFARKGGVLFIMQNRSHIGLRRYISNK